MVFIVYLVQYVFRGVMILDNSSLEGSMNDSEKILRQIMARNKDSMMKMSYMQLQNKELANVAVSNIFMVVYKRLYKYPGIEKEKAWICAIAVKEWRRQSRRKAFGMKPLILTQRR